ncbi:MAG TPA: DoxX family protein [Fimbriimonadales bacterium]|nr:DoxX family protein [Fimbriimonadales bacterium]
MKLHNLLFGGSGANSLVGEFGAFIIRFAFGLTLMLAHGLGKLPPNAKFIEGVGNLGFPVPEFFAWCSALAEFLGGALLAVGLLTRLAALSIVINMAVAYFMVHGADPFQKKEMAMLYGVVALGFLFFGGGKLSLDGVISKR